MAGLWMVSVLNCGQIVAQIVSCRVYNVKWILKVDL